MTKKIFTNQTTNIVSAPIRMHGRVEVDVSGTLGGADVITWYKGANDIATPVRTCSWFTSLSDVLGIAGSDADGGYEYIDNAEVYFEIRNAGGGTNISLQFSAEQYD